MCLLDGVLSWDAVQIECLADSHRLPTNPLRRSGQLHILAGVEYAAQAMALHGVLTDGADTAYARAGYLASLRQISCHVDRLDLVPASLLVAAHRLYGEAGRSVYSFRLQHDDRTLLEGRAVVALAAERS